MANEARIGILGRLETLGLKDYDPSDAKIGVVVTDVDGMCNSIKLDLMAAKQKLEHLYDKVLAPSNPKGAETIAVREMIAALS